MGAVFLMPAVNCHLKFTLFKLPLSTHNITKDKPHTFTSNVYKFTPIVVFLSYTLIHEY